MMWGTNIPILTPEAREKERHNERVRKALKAITHASDGSELMHWIGLSEGTIQHKYAVAVADLLKAEYDRGYADAAPDGAFDI